MAFINIKEKDKTSTTYDVKNLLDTDMNQVRGALQTADYDINTGKLVATEIGVGTANPGGVIHASSADAPNDILGYFESTDTGTNIASIVDIRAQSGTDTLALMRFRNDSDYWMMGINSDDKFHIESRFAGTFSAPAFTIDQSNNVGIGTTSPENLLHIYRNTSLDDEAMLQLEEDGSGDAYIRYRLTGSTSWSTGVDNSDSDKFKISSTTSLNSYVRLTLDKSGNVGIGTTSPTQALEVNGAIQTAGLLSSNTITLANDKFFVFSKADTSSGGYIKMDSSNNFEFVTHGYAHQIQIDASDIVMQTKTTGNVGIGTTSPAHKLEVNGGVEISEYLGVGRAPSTSYGLLVAGRPSGDIALFQDSGSNSKVIIKESGNVGIGATSPGALTHIYRNLGSASTSTPVCFIEQDNSGDDQPALKIQQDGGNSGILVDQNGDSSTRGAIAIDNSGGGIGFFYEASAPLNSDRSGLRIFSNQAETSARNLAEFKLASASSTVTVVDIENSGTGNGLFIDQNGDGIALDIDSEATTQPALKIESQATDGTNLFEVRGNTGGVYFSSRQEDSITNKALIQIGDYNLWVDSTGDLRIKFGNPTSDTDGTVVGTQS